MSAPASNACGSPVASSSVRRSCRSASIPPAMRLTSSPMLSVRVSSPTANGECVSA